MYLRNKIYKAVDWCCAAHVTLDKWLDIAAAMDWLTLPFTFILSSLPIKVRMKCLSMPIEHVWLRFPGVNTYEGEDKPAFSDLLKMWARCRALKPLRRRREEEVAASNFWKARWRRTYASANSDEPGEDMRQNTFRDPLSSWPESPRCCWLPSSYVSLSAPWLRSVLEKWMAIKLEEIARAFILIRDFGPKLSSSWTSTRSDFDQQY